MERGNPEIDALVQQQPESVQKIMQALRELVLSASEDLVETKKWGMPSYGNGKNVCYLQPAKKHVNLGFYQGGTLAAEHPQLVGTGKEMRHIRITSVDGIQKEQLTRLVEAAVALSK